MRCRLRLVAAFVVAVSLGLSFAPRAEAHFLFIRLGEHAEGGRAVEAFFSEAAISGDPKFVAKIAGTQLWLQTEPGMFQPLAVRPLTDRLRASVPAAGAASIVGVCEYGVLARKTSFLLRYYPKAIAGDPEQIARFAPRKQIPFEIVATVENGGIAFTALADGKPVPNAKFTTVDDDLVNDELVSDGAGRAAWKPPAAGHYCVYTSRTLAEGGERNGESYTEVREFATLSFTWPLAGRAADEDAVALFERALAARASWEKFPGFSADVSGTFDGAAFSGRATVDGSGQATADVSPEGAAAWVREQLGSIVLHRARAAGGDRPVVRFADRDESHPMGRLLAFSGGQFASSYRVKDAQILVVNRNFGKRNMTISVSENVRNAEGKFLPRFYTVTWWDAATGRLDSSQTVRNDWTRVGTFDLPTLISTTTASDAGQSLRELRLSMPTLRESP